MADGDDARRPRRSWSRSATGRCSARLEGRADRRDRASAQGAAPVSRCPRSNGAPPPAATSSTRASRPRAGFLNDKELPPLRLRREARPRLARLSRRCSRPTAACVLVNRGYRPRGPQGSRHAPGRAACRRRRDHGARAPARGKAHCSLPTTTRQETSGTGATSPAWPRRRWAPRGPRTVCRSSSTPRPRRRARAAGPRAASRGSSCRTGTWNTRSPGTASPPRSLAVFAAFAITRWRQPVRRLKSLPALGLTGRTCALAALGRDACLFRLGRATRVPCRARQQGASRRLQYISTRGEAPPARLRGRDCWPGSRATAGCTCRRPGRRFRAETIASLRRPAVRRGRRRGRSIPSSATPSRAPSSARMARDAYARFGHPAVTPLVADRPQPLGAGAVPRADAGLQGRGDAAARPPHGPRAGEARRAAPPSSAPPRATPAAPRSRPSAARAASTS